MKRNDPIGNQKKHGLLRIWVLNLLTQDRLKGSELMNEIEKQSMGWWRPSPGSIYPLLSTLESSDFIQKDVNGRYGITETGIEIMTKYKEKLKYFYNQTNPSGIPEILDNINSELMFILDSDEDFSNIKVKIEEIEKKIKMIREKEQ
ncbi:MAG: PadR family transcriptional regulator [Thermoplasmataceae archaeon]